MGKGAKRRLGWTLLLVLVAGLNIYCRGGSEGGGDLFGGGEVGPGEVDGQEVFEEGEVSDLEGVGGDGEVLDPKVDGEEPQEVHKSLWAGQSKLEVTGKSGFLELELSRDDKVLLKMSKEDFILGRVDALEEGLSYDPWFLYPASGATDFVVPPAGLAFLAPMAAEAVELEDGPVEIRLEYQEGLSARLKVEVDGQDRFKMRLEPEDGGPPLAYVRLRFRASADEGFYGLGAWHDHVNHRGRTRAMQMEVDLESESGTNEGHVRIPLLIGSRGWGVFVDSLFGMVFDVATQAEDLVEVTVGSGEGTRDGLEFYVFTAPHPLEATRHYYELTGAPRLPAYWALGPWIWRDEGVDQAKVIADLEAIRDFDLAATGYWIDRPYASAVNSFDFNPADYPDPAAMIGRAHELGFRMALWHAPYVNPKEEASRPYYDFAKEHGYFPPLIGVTFDKWGPIIDFTNPQAYSWWQGLLRAYKDLGIEGYKLDYGEEVVLGVFGVRTPWLFYDGSDDRTMHHRYQWWYHKVYAEMLPEEGGFLLCRTATIGDQVHGPIIWPGDLDATFWPHGHEFNKDGYPKKAVGGLPASMVYGLSLGPSGFPFYGADTGGYIHAPPDKELFTRWFEQTALSSVMQVGNGASTVPWELGGEDGYDEEMLEWYRAYARLHLRLWPYEWTLAKRIGATGRPIVRPFGLQYPDMGEHPWDIYFFGDDLLVAPVVERDAREKTVIFPHGRWADFWDGSVWEGPDKVTVPAPLSKLPLYIREGGIVPMLRPTIDSLAPTIEPERVDSFATSPGILYVRLFPGPPAEFEVFDGTTISTLRESESLVHIELKAGNVFREGVIFEVYGASTPPVRVTVDGVEVSEVQDPEDLGGLLTGWSFNENRVPSLSIRCPDGSHEVTLEWQEGSL